MKNHDLATATPTATKGADAFTEALANLSDAGIAFAEVAGCPHPSCALCAPRGLAHAA